MDVGCSRMRRLASSPSPLLHAKLVSRSSSSYAAAAAPLLTPRASAAAGAGAHGFEFSPSAGMVLLKGMSYPDSKLFCALAEMGSMPRLQAWSGSNAVEAPVWERRMGTFLRRTRRFE